MTSNIIEHTSYISYMLGKIVAAWDCKAISGAVLAIFSFFFDTLQQEALTALLVLLIFDFFSALLAAYKTNEAIRSSKIFNTALKIVVYFSFVSVGFIAEKAVAIGFIDEVILGFLAVTELISILENISRAGYATPTGLLNTLKDFKSKR